MAFLKHFSSDERKVALVDSRSGARLSYGKLWSSAAALSRGLVSMGIRHGDVVMVVLANCIEFPVLLLGATAFGAVVTTANPQSTLSELQRQVRDSGACLVFSSRDIAAKVAALRLPMVLLEDTAETGLNFTPLSNLLREAADEVCSPAAEVRPSDTAVLLYSSGTTGVNKGVILSHSNITEALKILSLARQVPQDEVSLGILPMFHIAGLVFGLLNPLYHGVTVVVVPKFNLADLLCTIERYRVSLVICVPPILIALTKNYESSRKFDIACMKSVICGGAPLGNETAQAFLARFPQVTYFTQAYGLTETTGLGFGLSSDAFLGSAGRLMPNLQAKVVDLVTGKSLPAKGVGELCLRGPVIMQGYLNNPKATAEAIDKEGWLHTGDLVYIDTDGSMLVVDRVKELIKYKAFQVAPAELEALLLSHPSVLDCAVVPFPSEEAGEIPTAYIVCVPGCSISESEIIQFVSSQVAPHKKIRKVVLVDAIPKSPTGKILRKELKASLLSKL